MRKFILPFVLLLAASVASAQTTAPLTDVATRAHVTVNGGALVYTTQPNYSGPALGGALLYNLHQNFSVYGSYAHGFAINDLDGEKNFAQAMASVRVHPYATVGFGYGWFGPDVRGGLTQLVISKEVMHRVAFFGSYAHVFAAGDLDDFEYVRAGINYHLLGKE